MTNRTETGGRSAIGNNGWKQLSYRYWGIGLAGLALLILAVVLLRPEPASRPAAEYDAPGAILPSAAAELHTEDLPAMRERGVVRALVTPSLTDFFSLNGELLGIQTELLKHLEEQLNRDRPAGRLPTRIVYIPVSFSELIPALREGRGDIAAAVLTRTPSRERQVDFVGGVDFPISELVVHHADVDDIGSLEDLAGREIYVLSGSSYLEHLERLSDSFEDRGLAPVTAVEADPHLSSEDILEMVNAGLVDITVCDDYKAKLWAEVLPELRVREDLPIHRDGQAGWAVRQDNPELQAAIEAASRSVTKGTLLGNIFIERYFGSTRWVDNPLAREERRRFSETADLFRHYGDRYDFDWLALMAQAYQESRLDHSLRSSAGAVGIMQIRPATAADPNVGISDVQDLENNIHAGAKYMAFLKERYFSDPALTPADRLAFSWAAYNAGPRKVRQMRVHADELGLDPDQWFQNVEYAAMDIVGRETVRYVANVYKYYVAYRLSQNLITARATGAQSAL